MNTDKYYPQFPYATQLQTGEGYQGFGRGADYGVGIGYAGQYPWAGNDVDGLSGVFVPTMINDRQLEERIEELVRGATLKTLETENDLGSLTGNQFENVIESRTFQGLANGDIAPIKEQDFNRALYRYFSTGELGGFFDKIKKAVKKVGKKVKKVGKKIAKGVKKIIPAVVVGVATYFTGGAALPFLKKFSAQIGSKWGTWDKTVGKFLGRAPQPEEITSNINAPQITDLSVEVARQELAAQGVNVNTPQGKEMLAQYIRYKQNGYAQQMPPQMVTKPASTKTDTNKILIPLAVGAGALMLLKG